MGRGGKAEGLTYSSKSVQPQSLRHSHGIMGPYLPLDTWRMTLVSIGMTVSNRHLRETLFRLTYNTAQSLKNFTTHTLFRFPVTFQVVLSWGLTSSAICNASLGSFACSPYIQHRVVRENGN